MESDSLQQAITALREDPEKHFAPFYELTKNRVYALLFSYVREAAEAEDLLQETYITLLENLNRVKTQDKPLAYLYTTAKHLAIDALRKRKHPLELDKEETAEVIGFADPVSDESPQLLEEIKALLKPFEFQVYVLHVLSDMTFKEIAKTVHRPLGTLTYTYSIALDKLQKGLNPQWTQK